MPEPNPLLSPKEELQLSKLLSYLLRHGAVKEKLNISSDGFVAVNDIVSSRIAIRDEAQLTFGLVGSTQIQECHV